jgi:cob(I)alamin adenosyltransferase
MSTVKETRGLILIHTGDGKGKTTAALGILFRALGRGIKCGVIQFLKGKWETGEKLFAKSLPNSTFMSWVSDLPGTVTT